MIYLTTFPIHCSIEIAKTGSKKCSARPISYIIIPIILYPTIGLGHYVVEQKTVKGRFKPETKIPGFFIARINRAQIT